MCQSDVARSNARRVGHLPELEGGDLVVAALVLHLPEHLVQVQLLVGEGGHLVLALGAAVPVDEQAGEGVLVQPPHQVQHLLPCAWQAWSHWKLSFKLSISSIWLLTPDAMPNCSQLGITCSSTVCVF